jgi:hypothetical protein
MTARFSRLLSCALTLVLLSLSNPASAAAQKRLRPQALPKLLSVGEQLKVREGWLKTRLDTMLLPMMRRHKVEMWIVNERRVSSGTGRPLYRAANSLRRPPRFFYFY